jgi:hypothetical protein
LLVNSLAGCAKLSALATVPCTNTIGSLVLSQSTSLTMASQMPVASGPLTSSAAGSVAFAIAAAASSVEAPPSAGVGTTPASMVAAGPLSAGVGGRAASLEVAGGDAASLAVAALASRPVFPLGPSPSSSLQAAEKAMLAHNSQPARMTTALFMNQISTG